MSPDKGGDWFSSDARSGAFASLVEVAAYREMLFRLFDRDLKVRYRRSFAGFVVSLLQPLFMVVVLHVVFDTGLGIGFPRYWLFLLVSMVTWQFIRVTIGSNVDSIRGNSLVAFIHFPREILPLSFVLSNLVTFLLQLLLVLGVAAVGVRPPMAALLLLPLPILSLVLLVSGGSLLVSALSVFYRDVRQVVELLFAGLFYLCPIFYAAGSIPREMRFYYLLNPFAAVMTSLQEIIYAGRVPGTLLLITPVMAGLILYAGAAWIFDSFEPRFPEEP